MNKKIIKYIFVFIILLIILLIIVGVFRKKNSPVGVGNIETKTENKTITVSKIGSSGTFVFNGLVKNLELPKQIKTVSKEKVELNDETIDKIIKSFGDEYKISVDEPMFKRYETDDSGKIISIDKETNTVSYSVDLLNFPLKSKKTEINEEDLKSKTKQLIKDNLGLDQVDLFFRKITYEEVSDYISVLSNKEKADIIELQANYIINGYPVYNLEGFPLKISFTRDGTLVNLSFVWPDNIQKTEIYQQIKNLDEISKISKENFEIISVDGDSEGDIITLDSLKNNFSTTSGYFGFFSLPNFNFLVPSLILEGKSVIDKTTVYITLATPILK